EKCPRKKKTPNSCPVNGAVTGKLLITIHNQSALLQRHKFWVFYIPTLIMGFSPYRWVFFMPHP
ncbi:MAG: hypothetical protein ACI90V_011002, partial [Bacillariaceae sp.]